MTVNSRHGGYPVGDHHPPVLVGVINLSPESFYKDSITNNLDQVEQKIKEISDYGGHIIDVGAISSRPVQLYGGKLMGEEEEKHRVNMYLPHVLDIAGRYNLPVAIDTKSATTAELALNLGCTIVNDISGLKGDQRMAGILKDYDAEVVLMATKDRPGDTCGIAETMDALQASIAIAEVHGIDRNRIVIDPAFGGWQGKSASCDQKLITDFERLQDLGLPIYIGVSRKSTINTLDGGNDVNDRLVGSVILTHWLIDHGAHIIRTHDVKETVLGLNVMRNIRSLRN